MISLKLWPAILLSLHGFVIVTSGIERGDKDCNPYEPYSSTQTYKDVIAYFNDNKEICHLMDASSKGDLKKLILWLEENSEFEEQLKELEELGQTLIYVNRFDDDSTFLNNYVSNHPDCWFDYRQGLLKLKNNGHLYQLPELKSNKASYRAMNFHSIICPPHTALRGRTPNGIVCSRYNINLQPKLPTLIKDTNEDTICVVSKKNNQDLFCTIKSNNETVLLCKDLYVTVTEQPSSLLCTSRSQGCDSNDTACGILLPNIGGETKPGPIHICCSNKTETPAPIESFRNSVGKITNVSRIRQLLCDLKVCPLPHPAILTRRT